MASNLTSIHDQLKVVLAAVTGIETVSDSPEDYETWEAQAILPGERLPACHLRTEPATTVATTDGDLMETIAVTVRLLIPYKGSAKTVYNTIRDAVITAVYGDTTLWGLCDNVTPKGTKVEKQEEQLHRISIEFEIEHIWTPA